MTRRLASALLGCALCAIAGRAPADIGAGISAGRWLLCDAQTATGACTALPTSGDERVAQVEGFDMFTAFSAASTATAYSCRIVSNDEGYDAATPVGDGTTIAYLTSGQRQVSWSGSGSKLFAVCQSIAGGGVTITIRGMRSHP